MKYVGYLQNILTEMGENGLCTFYKYYVKNKYCTWIADKFSWTVLALYFHLNETVVFIDWGCLWLKKIIF